MTKITDINEIDWNAMWMAEAGHASGDPTQKELWNKRAAGFGKSVNKVITGEDLDKEDYYYKMLERIELKPEWTVLDVGCGTGTLAVHLAKKCAGLTALDISGEMLKQLRGNAERYNLKNIRYLDSSWKDAFTEKKTGTHDVVVASRSLMSGNIRYALSSMNDLARQAVYLTLPIVHLPLDHEAYRVIGRVSHKNPPYIYVFNMLFQMGILANIEILHCKLNTRFSSIDEAIDSLQWRTDTFSPEETVKLRNFLENRLAKQNDSPYLRHDGKSRWALLWWRKE